MSIATRTSQQRDIAYRQRRLLGQLPATTEDLVDFAGGKDSPRYRTMVRDRTEMGVIYDAAQGVWRMP